MGTEVSGDVLATDTTRPSLMASDVVVGRVSGGIHSFCGETSGEGRAEVKQHTERCWDRSPGRSLGAPRVYKTYPMVTGYTISCSPLFAQADGLDPSPQRNKWGQLARF